MPLTLSDADLSRLHAAQSVLLSALEYPHVDEWRAAVNRALKEVLQIPRAVFSVPVKGAAPLYTEDHLEDAWAEYAAHYAPQDRSPELWRRAGSPPVSSTRMLCDSIPDGMEIYHSSQIYQEWYSPHGLRDTLLITDLSGATQMEMVAEEFPGSWIGYHPVEGTPACGERGLALAQLLHPAFQAGVRSVLRDHTRKESLARALDEIQEGLLLVSTAGEVLHENVSLRQTLAADSEAHLIEGEMRQMAGALLGVLQGAQKSRPLDPALRALREVRTHAGTYRVRGSLAGEGLFTREPALLIALERTTAALPPEEEIRRRWGLTRAQARVARLMAQGRGNPEIATELSVSPHTVRRHAEVVRMRLGVHSRAEVASRILRG